MANVPLSVLELLSVETAHPAVDVAGIIDVARSVERAGYERIWYAEHHDSQHLIPYPPAVVVTRIASATSTIRVGSGGVLAVNHAPLVLAEQFEAMAAFFPGRIDMGIGRGPGTSNEAVARAVRQGREPATEHEYRVNMAEILRRLGSHSEQAQPWLLASSPAGAAVAANLGLPMAFAHFLRPSNTAAAVERYRAEFLPSRWCEAPRLMLAVLAVCADTQADAEALARPTDVLRARSHTGEVDRPLLDIAAAADYEFTAEENEFVVASREHIALGTPQVVEAQLAQMVDMSGAEELMVHSPIVDASSRAHSYQLIMKNRPRR